MHLINYLALLTFIFISSCNTMDLEIIKQKNENHTGSFIFLHGATRSGKWQKEMFLDYLGDKVQFNHIKIIFPTSPVRYSEKFGEAINIWFDSGSDEKFNSDMLQAELDQAAETVKSIIIEEQKNGIPLQRIVIGGISQGGMLAIHSAYSFIPEIAACIAVSSLVAHDSIFEAVKSRTTNPPLFLYHGTNDEIVPLKLGKEAHEKMSELGVSSQFLQFEEAPHELTPEELESIYERINILIPEVMESSKINKEEL